MFLHSFHHKILFDLLATVVRYTILNLFLAYKLQPPIRSTTFGLIICNYCFIFYGVLQSVCLYIKHVCLKYMIHTAETIFKFWSELVGSGGKFLYKGTFKLRVDSILLVLAHVSLV